MSGIPSEGALYWALMQYAEVMSISKNRLTKLQRDTRKAAAVSSDSFSSSVSRQSSMKNPISRASKISRTSLINRRSKRDPSLESKSHEAILTASETGIGELEKVLASVEGTGRVCDFRVFFFFLGGKWIFQRPFPVRIFFLDQFLLDPSGSLAQSFHALEQLPSNFSSTTEKTKNSHRQQNSIARYRFRWTQ